MRKYGSGFGRTLNFHHTSWGPEKDKGQKSTLIDGQTDF